MCVWPVSSEFLRVSENKLSPLSLKLTASHAAMCTAETKRGARRKAETEFSWVRAEQLWGDKVQPVSQGLTQIMLNPIDSFRKSNCR